MTDAASEYARALAENQRYVESFDRRSLAPAPLTGLAIVACMDTRLVVEDVLGLRPGDAHVIRNAGGLVTDDVIRSLIISQQLMGTTEVLIIEHTKCGLHGAREADIRGRAARMTGESPDAVDIVFGAFPDLEANLRDQVDRVRSDPYLKHVPVHGLIYDVTTGRLHEVV